MTGREVFQLTSISFLLLILLKLLPLLILHHRSTGLYQKLTTRHKGYVCKCTKYGGVRKNDYDAHLIRAHDEGDAFKCHICDKRNFASKKPLKEHIRLQHEGKFKHKHTDLDVHEQPCIFGMSDRQLFITHQKSKHRIVEFHSYTCDKLFAGKYILKSTI